MKDKREQAAITIQAKIRGFLARKAYQIKQMPQNELKEYKVFIMGNDPKIEGLPCHPPHEKIALIGTSGMYSLEIACTLSEGQPKLIILDNSKQVVEFWRKAREIMTEAITKEEFLIKLRTYVSQSNCNHTMLTEFEFRYLKMLTQLSEFEKIKKVISGATILGQSWADKDILVKLKNILALNGITTIYTYSSNIAPFLAKNEKHSMQFMLQNIEQLNPTMAIHSNLIDKKPEKCFFITDHRPSKVKEILGIEKKQLKLN